MELYYMHLITKYRRSGEKSFGEKEDDITYFDSLPYAVREMKELSETTDVCKVILACVGKAYICNHELCCDIPLFFCENYNVIPNTNNQTAYDYAKEKDAE